LPGLIAGPAILGTRAHENLKRAPASHAESGTRIHAKKGELLRIDSILPSDDQALEEVGLIGVDSLKFA